MDSGQPNLSQASASEKKHTNTNLGILFIGFIILQFYIVPLIGLAAGADLNNYTDYLYLYAIISYTMIVLCIIILHNKGLQVFQDHFSLWIIVFACFLAAGLGKEDDLIYRIFLILLGLRLSIHVIANRMRIKTPPLKSIFIGLLWSISTVIAISLLLKFLSSSREAFPPNWLLYIINTLVFQVSFVTVIEEAYFRGLLFGFLVKNGYEENKALVIQALLFWGVHYLKIITNPSLFFIAIPALTLTTTLIIRKYKMLYLSIMIHTFANVLGPVLMAIL